MLVTLWRHGEAGQAASDAARELTVRGGEHVGMTVKAYKDWCQNTKVELPSYCAHSPLTRTCQTASILDAHLCFETLVSHDQLAPGQRSYSHGRFLQDDVAHQLIVGHQPYLSELINVWCDTAQYHGLSTSGVAIIRLLMPSRGGGALLYYEPEGFLF